MRGIFSRKTNETGELVSLLSNDENSILTELISEGRLTICGARENHLSIFLGKDRLKGKNLDERMAYAKTLPTYQTILDMDITNESSEHIGYSRISWQMKKEYVGEIQQLSEMAKDGEITLAKEEPLESYLDNLAET